MATKIVKTLKFPNNEDDFQINAVKLEGKRASDFAVKSEIPTKVSELTNDAGYKTTDNNTTYTFATGDSNGQIKVTPSSGNAQNVSVKGLGSAAYATKGAANGVAELDASGKVLTTQLPSYVDDVLEYSAKSSFPATGETGKIYVDTSTNKTYRWSGSAYVEISASLALGETSSTAYRGDRGKIAYDHSQSAHLALGTTSTTAYYGDKGKTAYDHSQATHARTDATAVAASTTNGKIKINGTETTVYSLPTASSGTLGGVKIGSNISISSGTISVPKADGTTAGVTVVYPAASCTTFSSDSGTVTPAAVQKGAKMFAITRPAASTVNAVTRYSNTTGDVKDSKITIEDVTNTRDSSKKANVLVIPAEGNKKMVYGYCTDQVDGTSFIGGVFDASATSYPYNAGLAIGGTSGNLLWKGKRVLDSDDLTTINNSYVPTSRKINGKALSSNITLNTDDLDGGSETWHFNCGTSTTVLD